MRVQYFPLLAGLVVIGLRAPAFAQPPGTEVHDLFTWAQAADTLRAVAAGTRITLRSAFLESGSVRVDVGGTPLAATSYQVNYHLGTIRFLEEVPSDAVVIVHYRRRPFLIAPVYSLRPVEVSPTTPADERSVREVVVRPPEPAVSPSLVFGGTKSVSFATGTNRGSTLDQSLEATVEGKLTPTISVRVGPGHNAVTVTPVPRRSSARPSENERTNALVALYRVIPGTD